MKILHLSKFYPPYKGGIEHYLFHLNEALHQFDDIQSDVLCFNEVARNQTEYSSKRYHIFRTATLFKIWSQPISIHYLIWLFRNAHKYDLIVLHFPDPWADLSLLLSRFKGKIAIVWHNDIVNQRIVLPFYRPLLNWLLNKANAIIFTSPTFQSADIPAKYDAKKYVIPIGLSTSNLKKVGVAEVITFRQQLGNPKRIVFSLGRQVPYKGFNYLIKAAHLIPDDYLILIGGTGAYFNDYQTLIKEEKLEGKVKMLGEISSQDLALYFQAADMFVMSSINYSEAFGIVQLEAMYYEKPIISTRIPNSGVAWVNQHEISGLTVEPQDETALAIAINQLGQSDEAIERLGKGGRERLNALFTVGNMAEATYNLYKKILTKA